MSSSFDESLVEFQRFLERNGYPREVIWVTPRDVLVSREPLIYVRVPVPRDNELHVRRLFDLGITQQTGVLFDTVCEGEGVTFSYAWVPCDDLEAEEALMPKGLKMSAKTGASRMTAKAVRSNMQWLYLWLKYRKEQKLKSHLFLRSEAGGATEHGG
jgi:hypothetical protein